MRRRSSSIRVPRPFVSIRVVSALLVGLAPLVRGQVGGTDFCERYFETGFPVNCSDDTFEVRFASGTNVELEPTSPFEIEVVTDLVSTQVGGWSYALSHDPSVLRLVEGSVTSEGTDGAARFIEPYFEYHGLIDPGGDSRPGFVTQVVLSLAARRNWLEPGGVRTLTRARYEIVGEIPSHGTVLRFEDDLASSSGSDRILTRILDSRLPYGPRRVFHGVLGEGQIVYRGEDIALLERNCHREEICHEDRFEIRFGGPDGPHAHSTELDGETIDVAVVLQSVTPRPNGFRFAISHDPSVLTLLREDVTAEGTDVASFPELSLFYFVHPGTEEYYAGVVGFGVPAAGTEEILRPGTNVLAYLRYRVTGEIPEHGTLLRFQDNETFGPPAFGGDTFVFVEGESSGVTPRFYQHGLVVRRGVIGGRFQRGDADGNGALSISDAVRILAFVRGDGGTRADVCLDSLDTDDNGRVDFIDAAALLRFLFAQAAPPAPPAEGCGLDPTSDGLDCRRAHCER